MATLKNISIIPFSVILFSLAQAIEPRTKSDLQVEGKPIAPEVQREVERLKADDPEVRVDAAKELGAMGEKAVSAIPFLIEALTDQGAVDGPNGHRFPGPSSGGVRLSSDMPAHQAAKALGRIGRPSVEPLIDAIRNHFRPLSFFSAGSIADQYGPEHIGNRGLGNAEIALSEIGSPAVEQLIAVLDDNDRLVRIAATWALGRIGDPRAVKPLTLSLKDQDKYVRRGAAFALGSIGDKRALEPLTLALNEDEDWHVRRKAATGLGQLNDKRAVEPLIAAMRRVDEIRGAIYRNGMEEDVRRSAARSLGWLGDERAVEPLIEALTDEDISLRIRAIYALGGIGEIRAAQPLINALSEPEEGVRRAAKSTLDKIKAKYTATKPWPEKYEYSRQINIADVLEMTFSTDKTTYKQHEPVKLTVTLTNRTDKEVRFWRPGQGEGFIRMSMKHPNDGRVIDEFRNRNSTNVFPTDPVRIKSGESFRCTKTLEPYHLGEHTIIGSFRLRQVPDEWQGSLKAKPISFIVKDSTHSERLLKVKFDRLMAVCRREYDADPATCNWIRIAFLGSGAAKYLAAEIEASPDPKFRRRMSYALERMTGRNGKR